MAIGFFDSGMGGISVMELASRFLPCEKLIFFGDNANAPYGVRDAAEIRRLTFAGAETLLDKGIDALVIACNTATGAAINELRAELSVPVIGMEPAVLPALSATDKNVLVLATNATISLPKYKSLIAKSGQEHRIVSVPCPGLVELVESSAPKEDIFRFFDNTLPSAARENLGAVVLGCTHYVVIKSIIREYFGIPNIIDGHLGTILHLKEVLTQNGLLRRDGGDPEIYSSSGDETVNNAWTIYNKLSSEGKMDKSTLHEKTVECFVEKHLNCAQSVLQILAEHYGFVCDIVPDAAAVFGGGMAGRREICGALTGAFMAVGVLLGKGMAANAVCGELIERLEKRNGSYICGELTYMPGDTEAMNAFTAGNGRETICLPIVEYICGEVMNLLPKEKYAKQ